MAEVAVVGENVNPAVPGPSVIKPNFPTGESAHDRFLKKHVPAVVISGAVNVVFLLAAIVLGRGGSVGVESNSDILQAIVDQQEADAKKLDVTNPDLGIDSEIKSNVDVSRVETVNVKAAVTPEPVGLPTAESTKPLDVLQQAGQGTTDNLGVAGTDGMFKMGDGGAGGLNVAAGFRGRSGAAKDRMIREGGGTDGSEQANARGLTWLAKQQRKGTEEVKGSWVFVGGKHSGDVCAATAMALLPFLASGQTHKPGKGIIYDKVVLDGINYLIKLQKPSTGAFRDAVPSTYMYSHALATIALCELYGLTGDQRILFHAKAAVDYIIKAQGPNGSWGYQAGQDGDTSIVGWQIQALKSAEYSKDIVVPKSTFDKARKFLDSVSSGPLKADFGYTTPNGGPGKTLSAVGLLCRYYMDGWGPLHPGLQSGVAALIRNNPPGKAKFDMYYYYYATQIVFFHEGDAWKKDWNPAMRDLLIKTQVPQDPPEPEKKLHAGSWDPDDADIGLSCGRLGTTCMVLLTLEVYYRHLPLYKPRTEGIVELERVK